MGKATGRNYKVETARRRARETEARKRIQTDKDLASLQPHRLCLPKEKRLDPMADSLIGRLHLGGYVTTPMFEGALRFLAEFNAYRAVIGSIDPYYRPAPGWSGDVSPEEARRRKERYDAAYEAMFGSKYNQRASKAVSRVVVYSEAYDGPFEHLTCGLSALAKHYRLTENRKSPMTYIRSSLTAPEPCPAG